VPVANAGTCEITGVASCRSSDLLCDVHGGRFAPWELMQDLHVTGLNRSARYGLSGNLPTSWCGRAASASVPAGCGVVSLSMAFVATAASVAYNAGWNEEDLS
jgi:hypothetical protein